MPKVSVLVTSYNHDRYIRECVDSALTQTHPDVEVVVVDDGSTDSSQEILRSYGDNIRLVINDPNVGTYPSLNRALEIATGEYAAVLNSDDVWRPEKLERQVDLMETDSQLTFCHTYGSFIDANGDEVPGAPMGFRFPRTPTGDVLEIFVANNTAIASSVMIRTHVARQIGGFDASYRNLGDWDMWLRLAEHGPVGFVDDRLTLYRVHGSNTIYSTETTRSEEVRIRSTHRDRIGELLSRATYKQEMKTSLAHSLACLGSLHSIAGNGREARKCFLESLKLNPKRAKSALRYVLTFAPLAVRRRLL